MVEMSPVKRSTHIAAIGHDPEANELHVSFKSGHTYVYQGVKADQHQALIGAPSIGAHLHKHIRPNHAARRP